jgi:uncharacterized membrane protein HdeD (DUF308 family)
MIDVTFLIEPIHTMGIVIFIIGAIVELWYQTTHKDSSNYTRFWVSGVLGYLCIVGSGMMSGKYIVNASTTLLYIFAMATGIVSVIEYVNDDFERSDPVDLMNTIAFVCLAIISVFYEI